MSLLYGAYQNGNLILKEKTCERIAAENGVARNTVIRAEQFANGVDAAEEAVPGTREKILSGKVKPTAAELASVSRAAPEERPPCGGDLQSAAGETGGPGKAVSPRKD